MPIDSASLLLGIIGKGGKERRVPLPQPVRDSLRRLWSTHHNPRWLFPNRRGTKPVDRQVLGGTLPCRDARGRHHTARDATHPPAQLCDAAVGERRRCAGRPDPARPRQHCHHRHLHPPDRADPDLAQGHPRQADDRPPTPPISHDRGRGRLPPLRGQLPVCVWRIDAALPSARHH